MALILLTEYADRHGKVRASVTQKANRGTFRTARKIGRQWFIDEDEPYTDAKVTSGKYIGARKKAARNKSADAQE